MSKITNIPSEIKSFFSEKRKNSVMDTFSNLLDSLHFDSRCLDGPKRENCQLTNLQIFQIIVLMPFFTIKGFSHYPESLLNRMFGCKKDVFYSFMAQDNIDWSNLIYRTVVRLISLHYSIFADVIIWPRKHLSNEPFNDIYIFLFVYYRYFP